MLQVIIGTTLYTATLFQNESTDALKAILPLKVNMSELNGNEKYFYLPSNLPTKDSIVGRIKVGDIMLFGNNCLVLFYKNFTTNYRYTKVGEIKDTNGLSEALGKGNVTVTFQIE